LNTSVVRAEWTFGQQPLTPEEEAYVARRTERLREGTAYQAVHAEKPATIGFALRDSPVGLAALMLEKFQGWTEVESSAPPPLEVDALLATVSAFWFGTTAPEHWMYQTQRPGAGGSVMPTGRRVEVPTAFLILPSDIAAPPPDSWLERSYR